MLHYFSCRLENSVQQGPSPGEAGSGAPSLLEVCAICIVFCLSYVFLSLTFHLALTFDLQTGKALTAKGMQVLEFVGKETMDLLITETGLGVEKNRVDFKDQILEEVTFDRCFYIYGGPEQLEVTYLSLKITCLFILG